MKKKQIRSLPKPPQFKTTCFAALSGLTIDQKSDLKPPASEKPQPVQPAYEETGLFQNAMRDVIPLHGDKTLASRDYPVRTDLVPASDPPEPQEDMLLFMGEVGRLKIEKQFAETIDEPPPPTRSRRQRQAKRGEVKIEQQLDLHGMTREEAWERLPRFVRNARQQGVKTLLIITGRGNNSPEGPVLPGVVDRWLRDEGKEYVVEFFPAPPAMGGAGARLVFLRTPANTSSRDPHHSPFQADRE